MKNLKLIIALISLAAVPAYSQQSATTIDQLLDRVQQGKLADTKENQQRETEFRQKRDQQERLLADAETTKINEENRSADLEVLFEANEAVNSELQDTLNERLGALKELFGVMQQVSGDARTRFDNSLTNVQYPDRSIFLENLAKKIGSNSKLPSIEEIERLWFMLQQEMTESGKVVKFTAYVIDTNGSKVATEVVRVGLFNIVADGKYLNYAPETGNVTEIPRQPEGRRFTSSTSELFNPSDQKVAFGLDPTLGGVLASLVARPNLVERVQQGGIVGYLVILLGFFGVGIAGQRWFVLQAADKAVTAQLESSSISDDNALGRVLGVYESNKSVDTDTLELKLAEAVFKETPELNKGLLIIKVIGLLYLYLSLCIIL